MNAKTMTFGLLRAIRDSGQSLNSIANATDIDKSALGRFVARKQSLRLDLADRLALHFGLVLTKGMVTHGSGTRRKK